VAFTKIDGITLNTAVTYVQVPKTVQNPDGTEKVVSAWEFDQSSDSYKAKALLDSFGITYNWLNYADPAQHVEVFPNLNTWVFEDGQHTFNSFPFLIYTKCDDELPLDKWPKVVLMGLQAIEASDIAALYAIGRPTNGA